MVGFGVRPRTRAVMGGSRDVADWWEGLLAPVAGSAPPAHLPRGLFPASYVAPFDAASAAEARRASTLKPARNATLRRKTNIAID
jgi:hypothetical protein